MITENSHPLSVWAALKNEHERLTDDLAVSECAAERAHQLFVDHRSAVDSTRKKMREIEMLIGPQA